ncbi:hypothetical protein FRC17_009062 [Serendipita sp. 399]|nr:hypothetical protein FRC17_009062 [Serendipita sp. 399]
MDGPRSNAANSQTYIGTTPTVTVALEGRQLPQQDMNKLILNSSTMKVSRSATTNAALEQVTRSRMGMDRTAPLERHAVARSATEPNSSSTVPRRRSIDVNDNSRGPSSTVENPHQSQLSPRSNSPPRASFDSDLWNYYKNRQRRLSLPSVDASHIAQSSARQPRRPSEAERTVTPSIKSNTRNPLSKLFGSSKQRKPSISGAFNVQHISHVTYDETSGRFVGLPSEWEERLQNASGGERWGALMGRSQPPLERHSISDPVSPSAGHEQNSRDPRRLTHSSIADSLYSYESRYQRPAERPVSFPSTISSVRDLSTGLVDLSDGPSEEPARLVASTTPITPRPLPPPPLP